MNFTFAGKPTDKKEIRAGFIGCGAHSFRNIYPNFQFTPVSLIAVCDVQIDRAEAYAKQFGAENAYRDYKEMLEKEALDAVFIVTNYDGEGRPTFPRIAIDCLNAGVHVWIEKPPAGSVADIEAMMAASEKNGKIVEVGFKKMFAPANEKAKLLSESADFGKLAMAMLQYPQYIPTQEEFQYYIDRKGYNNATSFLDHLCHPVSLLLFLMGMPKTLYYERSESGCGSAVFTFENGAMATLAMTHGASANGGMERTVLLSDSWRHITVENNTKLIYHKSPPSLGYGVDPNYFRGEPQDTSSVWEPEFSLGQVYNKAIFLLGYFGEINEFANAVLENRQPQKGTLLQAWQATRIFEAFFEGPGKKIEL